MRLGIGLLISSLVLACACGGDDDATPDARPPSDAPVNVDAVQIDALLGDAGTASIPEVLPDPLPTGAVDLTVVTFNAGIIATVKGPAERLPLIITELKALDADLICLQEVYRGPFTRPEAFAAAVADVYPYSYWTETGQFASYNGSLIVSKHPLYRGREVYYSEGNDGPQTVDRMGLGVTVVDKDDAWYANVLCTHFHAGLDTEDVGWKTTEMNELIGLGQTEGYYSAPTFMLGDFNAGPAPPPSDCECEEVASSCDPACKPADMTSYGTAITGGFTDPFETDPSPFYTSPRDQYTSLELIPGLYPNEPSQRIDHCFYRNLGTSEFLSGEMLFGETRDIEINDGAETIHYLSDHNAVSCTFGPPS